MPRSPIRPAFILAGVGAAAVAGLLFALVAVRGDGSPTEANAGAFRASGEQALAAVDDGRITLEEYEAAVQRTIACGEAAGLVADTVPAEGLRPTHVDFRAGDADGVPDANTVRDAMGSATRCRAEHLVDVEQAFGEQQIRETSPESLAAVFERLSICMRNAGSLEASETLDFESLNAEQVKIERTPAEMKFLRDYQSCGQVVQAETGYRFY